MPWRNPACAIVGSYRKMRIGTPPYRIDVIIPFEVTTTQ